MWDSIWNIFSSASSVFTTSPTKSENQTKKRKRLEFSSDLRAEKRSTTIYRADKGKEKLDDSDTEVDSAQPNKRYKRNKTSYIPFSSSSHYEPNSISKGSSHSRQPEISNLSPVKPSAPRRIAKRSQSLYQPKTSLLLEREYRRSQLQLQKMFKKEQKSNIKTPFSIDLTDDSFDDLQNTSLNSSLYKKTKSPAKFQRTFADIKRTHSPQIEKTHLLNEISKSFALSIPSINVPLINPTVIVIEDDEELDIRTKKYVQEEEITNIFTKNYEKLDNLEKSRKQTKKEIALLKDKLSRKIKEEEEEKNKKIEYLLTYNIKTEQKKIKIKTEKEEDSTSPLSFTKEELLYLKKILTSGRDSDMITEGFDLELHRRDYKRLNPTEWLNDEIINFYLKLLDERSKSFAEEFGYPKCYFFNTFFYALLTTGGRYNYGRVQKWTRNVDLWKYDRVILPVHLGNHWCLAVMNMADSRVEYYDSLGGKNWDCIEKLKKYLEDEAKTKKKDPIVWDHLMATHIPKQKNGYDCGVFMCMYADCVSRGEDFDFKQGDMPLLRKRMILELSKKNLRVY